MSTQEYPKALAPLEPWLNDPQVLEIMVDGSAKVYLERGGKFEDVPTPFRDDEHLMEAIQAIADVSGRTVDTSCPMADTRLFGDFRVNIVVPPISLVGPVLTIRRFARTPLTVKDLLRFGFWSEDMVQFLRACVVGRLNIVVAGGVGSGKTTVLNILAGMIPVQERIVTVENAGELQLPEELKRVVRLESRPPDMEGKGEVTIRDLVINSLRMRPDRIILGECRSAEALEMMQAMNTGHDGTMMSVHANSPRDVLARLEIMSTMHHITLPLLSVRQMMASAINLITYQELLRDGKRKLLKVAEVTGMQGDIVALQDIFEFRQTGVKDGQITGHFTATGHVPRFLDRISNVGIELPMRIFTPS